MAYSVCNTMPLLLTVSVNLSFTEGSYWVYTSHTWLYHHQLWQDLNKH